MNEEISRADAPCPTTVVCPHAGQSSTSSDSSFPTEAVLGGTLGGLCVIVLALILYAACRHWSKGRRRRPPLYRRDAGRRKPPAGAAIFTDPLFAYDVALPKPWHSWSHHMHPDVYIARPYVSARRQLSQRQVLAAMLDSREASSDREFCPRSGAGLRGIGGGGGGGGRMSDCDSQYEPSIIAGSFVYHSPTNLPPHLKRTSHASSHHSQGAGGGGGGGGGGGVFQRELRPDLSYDSFKNTHLYDGSSSRGVATSTLNNHYRHHHHQPSDFYL